MTAGLGPHDASIPRQTNLRTNHAAPERPPADAGAAIDPLSAADEQLRQAILMLRDTRSQLDLERRRYFDLFNRSPEAIVVTDGEGVVVEVNRAAAEWLGVAQPEARGAPLADFLAPAERAAFREDLGPLARALQGVRRKLTLQPTEGPPRLCEALVAPVACVDSAVRLSWQIRDVDSSASGGDAEACRALLDASPAVVWEADPEDGRFTYVSRAAEALLGYPAESWLEAAHFLAHRIHEEDRPFVQSTRRRQRYDRGDVELEYRLYAADGRTVWVREFSRLVVEPRSGAPRIAGLLLNITKRKRIERRLYYCRSEAESKVRELNHLCDLCHRLEISVHLPDVLSEILASTTAMQGAEMGTISMFDPDRRELHVAASLGLEETFLQGVRAFPLGDTPCSTAVVERRSVILDDVEAEGASGELRAMASTGGFRAIYTLPLCDRAGEPVGVLTTYFREPHRPSERQQQMVEAYARRASQFIEYARKHSGPPGAASGQGLRVPLSSIIEAIEELESNPDLDARRSALNVLRLQARQLAQLADELAAAAEPSSSPA